MHAFHIRIYILIPSLPISCAPDIERIESKEGIETIDQLRSIISVSMGDKATLRMARQELEDLYLGVPDDSVDLTFKDLPAASSWSFNAGAATAAPPPAEDDERERQKTALARSSTNIFTYKLESSDDGDVDDGGAKLQLADHRFVPAAGLDLPPLSPPPPHHHHRQQQQHRVDDDHHDDDDQCHHHHHHQKQQQHRGYIVAAAAAGNNITTTSSTSTVVGEAAGGRRSRRFAGGDEQWNNKQQHDPSTIVTSSRANYKRPGIPHSNICALCTDYVYLFRHRCLVCRPPL